MKSHALAGLEHLLKSPAAPTTKEGLQAYREMKKASGLSTGDLLEYVGKKSRMPSQAHNDKQQQEKRLQTLEK